MIRQIEVTIRGDKKHQDVAGFGGHVTEGWAVSGAGTPLNRVSSQGH